MQTGSQAKTASDYVVTNLTYIDTLISEATSQGLFHITVNNNFLTEDMITELKSNGYSVVKRNTSNELFDPYIISW